MNYFVIGELGSLVWVWAFWLWCL